MRIKFMLFAALLFIQAAFYSCKRSVKGEGPVKVEQRQVNDFNEIELSIPANITVVTADSFNCIITAQSNIIKVIDTKVKRETLNISSDYSFGDAKIEMVISLPGAEGLSINGSGSIKTLNTVKTESLKLNINGSGEMFVYAETDKLRAEVNGSGKCFIKGSSNFLRGEINGSGDLRGFDFNTVKTDLEINGSGNAEVTVSSDLDVAVHGSGNVIYKGSPHIKSDIVGSGTIKKGD